MELGIGIDNDFMLSVKAFLKQATRAVVLLLYASIPAKAQSMPTALLGRWQVVEVHINTNASRTLVYGWNDPRLRWRLFTFGPEAISNDTPEATPVPSPQAKVTRMKLTQLLAQSMAGSDDPAERPTPVGYDLKAESTEMVDVISISSPGGLWQGELGADGGLPGAWLYLSPKGHLVLRWYGETLLILHRLRDDAKPQASFSCAQATSPTEQAICASLELASFDRSVAEAYAIARDQVHDDAEQAQALQSSQRAWLAQRDACGCDAHALLASMKSRLRDLAAVSQD